MTRQWTAEQIAAVLPAAIQFMQLRTECNYAVAPFPESVAEVASDLLDACADEFERRARVAAEEAVKP